MNLRVVVCLFVLAASSAFAQFDTASVIGTVRDQTGAVVNNSKVTLQSVDTGVANVTNTDANGDFTFLNVRIGRYTLRAEASGFKAAVASEFTVTVSARQRVDLNLQLGATTETVDVQGGAVLLETDSSDRGTVINTQAIVNLPLNGRSYADLALLSPGVRKSALENQTATSRDASFNVNGQRSALNNFMVDGVDNNAYGTSNQGFSNQVVQLTPDAVAEFRVETDNYSAEYGRAAGAVINVTTRSGTNALHGAMWEYLRNTNLNAVGFFKPLGGVKPTFIQNQFGAAAGGPIRKDKMFIFGDYEGLRRITRSLNFSTVPTADQRAGNFGTPIRNAIT
ncbi:MAG: carboxypeptidase-like regulatory domain-containing protein, partial [Acidobacteriota bacterium]|nr:carboxypeptidase-like regulatory domain-containing protein [Acidobacteriota bacterium]